MTSPFGPDIRAPRSKPSPEEATARNASALVTVRLSGEELAVVERAAGAADLSLVEFIRQTAIRTARSQQED